MTAADSPPDAAWPPPNAATTTARKRPKRPAFAVLVLAAAVLRGGREFLPWQLALASSGVLLLAMVVWRLVVRHRTRRNAGVEMTPEQLRQQIVDAGVAPPAFVEDGSLLGASVLVVNQRSKLIEVVSEYGIFGHDGTTLGHVRQIGQGRFKRVLRFVGPWDQFFTHHFDVTDRNEVLVMRLTRPRKIFRTRLEVFDGHDRFVGRLVQQNVFGKVRFGIHDADGRQLGTLGAENWRAWDFRIELSAGHEVATITKSWEGALRTAFTNADRYVVHIHQRLEEPIRSLVVAGALTVDLALKQDPQGLAG